MSRFISAVSLTVFLFLCGVVTARAETVTLKAASFLPPQASFGWPFARWVDAVNERCAGQVAIELLAPGAVKAFEQPNALKTGVIDMMSGPATYYKGTIVEGDTAVLAEVSTAEQRDNGAWEYFNTLHNEKLNAWYLTAFGDGIPFHVYTNKPMENGRLDGMTMRVAPIYQAFFEALGARVVTLPPPDVYTALERGTVDGYGWPLWGVVDFGWHEVTKYRYEPGFYNVVVNILVNLDRWRAMSDEQRGCLTEMAVWLEQEWPSWKAPQDEKERRAQREAGIEVIDLGPEFKSLAHDTYWQQLEAASPEHVAELKKLLVR